MDPKRIFSVRLMAPAKDGADGGGGAADRGDEFVPTEDDTTTGSAGDDTLKGGADTTAGAGGEDTLKGAGGDDTTAGAGGEDTVEGGDKKDDKDKKKPGGIPWDRHKEMLKKERDARETAERELAKFRDGDRITAMNEEIAASEKKVETLDAEYAQLVTDGKHQDAARKMAEIRKIERETSEMKADFKAKVAETRAVERARYENTVEKLEAAYDVLNPEHADFDEDVSQDVLDLAETYNRRGETPAKALQRAAEKILGTESKKQKDAVTTDTKVSEEDKAKAVAEERRRAQVKKNLEAKDKQPAGKEKVGSNHDATGGGVDGKSVMQMKYDDFVKLDDEVLSRLRGDAVA
jgi:hypothetical protein